MMPRRKEAAVEAVRKILTAAYRRKMSGGNQEEWDETYATVKAAVDQAYPGNTTDKEAVVADMAVTVVLAEYRKKRP